MQVALSETKLNRYIYEAYESVWRAACYVCERACVSREVYSNETGLNSVYKYRTRSGDTDKQTILDCERGTDLCIVCG